MAKFPEYTEIPLFPIVDMRIRFNTLRTQFNTESVESRKRKFIYPRRDITVKYNHITKVHAETLWEFVIARAGSYESFNFFMPEPELSYPSYIGEYVGAGNGDTEVFNLPCKNSLAQTVYIDGVEQTESADYNIDAGTGEDGADRLEFNDSGMVAPNDGAIITIDFTGILKIRSVFADDMVTFSMFRDMLVSCGIELRGLLNQ